MIFNFNSKTEITHSFDESDFNQLTTVSGVTGDKLPTITGCGYMMLRRVAGSSTGTLDVYIDGNTQPFKLSTEYNYGIAGDFYKFYFQESIRFSNGLSTHTYLYQTLLAEKTVDKRYNIAQDIITNTNYINMSGRGKVLVSPAERGTTFYYSIDNGTEYSLSFRGNQYIELMFNESIKFKSEYGTTALYYIAYLEN